MQGVDFIEKHDFKSYSTEELARLKGANACIWALGTSQTLVSKEEYSQITEAYPLVAARALAPLNDKFTFVYVSAEGATQSPSFLTSRYGAVKGQAEAALLQLMDAYPSLRVYSMRQGAVDAQHDSAMFEFVRQSRAKRSAGERYAAPVVMPIFRVAVKGMISPTIWLGSVLKEMAIGNGEPFTGADLVENGRIVPNKAAKRIWSQLL